MATTTTVRTLGVVSAVLAVLLASGCGAGHNAATGREVPAIPGADAGAGPMALRDLLVPFQEGGYPAGSDVPLVVRMFSSAGQPVGLTQITSPAGRPMAVAARDIAVRQPASAASGEPLSALVIPPDGYLLLVPGSGPYLVAEDISAALPYGASVAVRFTFSTGDSVDVDVPMAPPDYPVTGPSAAPQSSPPTP
jgi:hypothetical protein